MNYCVGIDDSISLTVHEIIFVWAMTLLWLEGGLLEWIVMGRLNGGSSGDGCSIE